MGASRTLARAWAISVVLLGLLLTLPSAASATALPAKFTENTTLTAAGNPYTGSSTIESGVTVTVEPGVKFTIGALTVKGTLKAEGSAEEPIIFTGTKELAPSEWKNIAFEPGSGASVLDHVEVKYGGEKLSFNPHIGAVEVNASSPTIANSTFRNNNGYGIRMSHGGSPEIADNELFNNGEAAISYTSNTGDTGEINIHDNLVEGGPYGIGAWVFGSATVSAKTLSGNTVIGTKGIGLSYSGPEVPGNVTENMLTGNASNFIQIGGTVAKSSTWNDGGTPVKVEGGLTVAAAATLKIGPGVYMMRPNMTVKGTLKAEGSAEDPIVFTGVAQTTPGEWKNIKFEPGSGASVLDHVEVKYGGEGTSIGAVEVSASSPKISNSVFRKNKSQGVYVPSGGSPEIADSDFFENGAYAIQYSANTGNSGEINIHGNYVEKGGGGIFARVFGTATVAGTTLSSNTIIGTTAEGVNYLGTDIPGDITNNTLSGNAFNRIAIAGTVTHTSTWTDSGSPVWFEQDVTVASGATLNIKPGLLLNPRKLTVKGTLKAEGTAEEPVVFTGTKGLAPGEWKSIVFEPGSGASVLDHVEAAFGGDGTTDIVEVKGSSPTITNSTIRKSKNLGIDVTESGAPKIEWNRFRGNATRALLHRHRQSLSSQQRLGLCQWPETCRLRRLRELQSQLETSGPAPRTGWSLSRRGIPMRRRCRPGQPRHRPSLLLPP